MPGLPLQNPRWEKFCHAYVRGPTAGNATASYLAAGFAADGTQGSSARVGAYKLMNKPVVSARITELQADVGQTEERAIAMATDRLALSQQMILGQFVRFGFAHMLDYVRRDEHGNTVIDLGAVTRDQAAGIVELTVTERGEGPNRVSQTRIKLCDRQAALVSLGKHFGLFNQKKEDQNPLRHLSAEELQRHNMELQQKIHGVQRGRAAAQAAEAQPAATDEGTSLANNAG